MSTSRILSTFLALGLATAAGAQCTCSGAGMQTYGQGCNPVFLNPPTLAVAFDGTRCTLDVTVQAFGGCCNTFLRAHLLALGLASTSVPLPQIGPNCVLLATPDAILFQPSTAGGVFSVSVPPIPMPFAFFAQGGALYFTTIGLSNDLAMTQGAQITLT